MPDFRKSIEERAGREADDAARQPLAGGLRARIRALATESGELDPATELAMPDAPAIAPAGAPARPVEQVVWQVILQPEDAAFRSLALDLARLTVLGRDDHAIGVYPDVDLSPYDAASLGVSRRHALLMPTRSGLYLVDLNSTNGTWVDGYYLEPGTKLRLLQGNKIEFGRLQMSVRLLDALVRPVDAADMGDATPRVRDTPST